MVKTKKDISGNTLFKNTHRITLEGVLKLSEIGVKVSVNDGEYCYCDYEE